MKTKKIKSVTYNNRKKQIALIYANGKKVTLHYGHLGITENLLNAWVDKETRGQSIGLKFANGKTDYVPYDQPLAIVKDADYLLQNQLEVVLSYIKEAIQSRKLSKKYLAEQLNTSENQIQRLLNPKIINKNLSQLYHLISLLHLELKLNIKEAA